VDAKPRSGADPATVPAAPDVVYHAVAPAHTAATGSKRTQLARLFFLMTLALGIAAALIALVSKMVGLTRTPRVSDHPDDAWRRYRTAPDQRADEAFLHEEDPPVLARQEPRGAADLDAREWIEQSPPAQADFPEARPQDGAPGQSEQVRPTMKDIELALRILREARHSITRT
jgi:hypothetical protein